MTVICSQPRRRPKLTGGPGSDVLEGSVYADRYVFHAGDGVDRLRDLGIGDALIFMDIAGSPEIVEGEDGVSVVYGDGDRVVLEGVQSIAYRPGSDHDVVMYYGDYGRAKRLQGEEGMYGQPGAVSVLASRFIDGNAIADAVLIIEQINK